MFLKCVHWLLIQATLGWYLTRLRVLVWLCRKEIATPFVYVWLMKGIFTLNLNPSAAKDFLPFTFPWEGLFNPSAGFVILKRGSIFSITGFSFPKWSSSNTRRLFLSPNGAHKASEIHILFAGGRKITAWRFCRRQIKYLDLQLWSTFRNLSFGPIGTYFESCGILRKYVLRNSSQSKKLTGNLPIGQLVSHTSKKATKANRHIFMQLSGVVVESTWCWRNCRLN